MLFFNRKSKEQSSDEELISGFKESGDTELAGILYNRYMQLVYGVCLKYLKNKDDAQDAVMHLFEKLVKDLPRFQIRNFHGWLYVYAKNFCLMKLRTRKGGFSITDLEEMEKSMENQLAMHPTDEPERLERDLQALEACIDRLVAEQKQCIQLFFLKELSYKQIAAKTEFELKKVKSYIQNGKRNLKICLEETSG